MKPTYGRVSRYGLIAFASSLDQIGPFAHDLSDLALVLEVIAGHDPRDSTSVEKPVPEYCKTLNEPVKGLKIGVPKEFFGEGLDSEIESAVRLALKEYEKRGATLVDVSLPHSKYALAAYYIVAPAEASSNLARFDGMHYGHRTMTKADLIATYAKSRGEAFGKEVQRRIMIGTYVLSSGYSEKYYHQALRVRRLVKQDYDDAFAKCDVIMGPTTPTAAFKAGEKSDDPLGHVPVRRLHRRLQSRGHTRHEHSVRVHERRVTDRATIARPAVRRGETSPRRPNVRVRDRLAHAPAEGVILISSSGVILDRSWRSGDSRSSVVRAGPVASRVAHDAPQAPDGKTAGRRRGVVNIHGPTRLDRFAVSGHFLGRRQHRLIRGEAKTTQIRGTSRRRPAVVTLPSVSPLLHKLGRAIILAPGFSGSSQAPNSRSLWRPTHG